MVPDLVGYQAGPAYNVLKSAGLVPWWTGTNKAYWFVTATTPGAGTMVAPGAKVQLVSSASVAGSTGAAAAGNWPGASAALAPAKDAQAAALWAYTGRQDAGWARPSPSGRAITLTGLSSPGSRTTCTTMAEGLGRAGRSGEPG